MPGLQRLKHNIDLIKTHEPAKLLFPDRSLSLREFEGTTNMVIYRSEFVHNSFPHVMSLKEEYFPLGVRSIPVYAVRGVIHEDVR